jgi:hypothetical protein
MKDYFSHDYNARNDKKLVTASMKYGLEAIGAYWCLVEMLYEEGGYLIIEEYERISFELRTSIELIKYLIHDSHLFENDGSKFWSITAIERLKMRANKSEKARKSIEARWKRKGDTNVFHSNYDCNTSKVKKIKGKDTPKPPQGNEYIFDEFRKIYPGRNRSLLTEFSNFTKRHKDWFECLSLLTPAIEKEITDHKQKKMDGEFAPEYANLQTWINQRRWETELPQKTNNEETKQHTKRKAIDLVQC